MTLVHELGWATVPVITLVAFTFMGIEGIADEIEQPFGLSNLLTQEFKANEGIATCLRKR